MATVDADAEPEPLADSAAWPEAQPERANTVMAMTAMRFMPGYSPDVRARLTSL